MKKQLLVLAIGTGIILSGCQEKEASGSAELQSVEASLPIVYKGLVIDLEPYVEGEEVMVKMNIHNDSNDEIPLQYENEELLLLEMKSPIGETQSSVIHSEQLSIKPGEGIVLEEKFRLPSEEGEYAIKAHLNLMDTEDFSYEAKQLDGVEVLIFERQQAMSFLPDHKMTYVYENRVGDEIKQVEEQFIHFQDGFVQSITPEIGTRIYYVDQKGIYLAYKNSDIQRANLIGKVDYNKQQILSFPAAVGSTWKTEGIQYEIIASDETYESVKKRFSDVVVIEADFGTGVRYYYHEEAGLLQVSIKDGDQWVVTSKLLKRY